MRILSFSLFGLISVGGCSAILNGTPREFRQAPVVQVENTGHSDLQIYAESKSLGYHDAQYLSDRVHLGRVRIGTRSEFTIPWYGVNGTTLLHLVAYEVKGKTAAFDQEFFLAAQDTVVLSIPLASHEQ